MISIFVLKNVKSHHFNEKIEAKSSAMNATIKSSLAKTFA